MVLGLGLFPQLEHERTEREKIYVDGKNPASLCIHDAAPFLTVTAIRGAKGRWRESDLMAGTVSGDPTRAPIARKARVDAQKRHDRMKSSSLVAS